MSTTTTTVSQGVGGIVHLGILDGFDSRTLCGRECVVSYRRDPLKAGALIKTVKDIVAATGEVECGRCKQLAERQAQA